MRIALKDIFYISSTPSLVCFYTSPPKIAMGPLASWKKTFTLTISLAFFIERLKAKAEYSCVWFGCSLWVHQFSQLPQRLPSKDRRSLSLILLLAFQAQRTRRALVFTSCDHESTDRRLLPLLCQVKSFGGSAAGQLVSHCWGMLFEGDCKGQVDWIKCE